MLIEDSSLRELFKVESEEHLQRLDELLLRLEHAPTDSSLIEEAFREAHSMKGAARMLGLRIILALTNRLENSLNQARQGTVTLEREHISQMLREVGEIRNHVAEATGSAIPDNVGTAAAKELPILSAAIAEVHSAPADVESTAEKAVPAVAPAPTFDEATKRIDSVRVDTRKLDELMTHAGELVVARSRASQRLGELDAVLDAFDAIQRNVGDLHDERFVSCMNSLQQLRNAYAEDGARLETLSNALEGAVRQIRMLPLASVFKPLPRMVRELGLEQGKEIELSLDGEDTLADKRILEEIKDPLVHLLRNAVDHGIEAPEQRVASGKLPLGRIAISASQSADQIVIVVRDDGIGLDLDAIRVTARQRGLLDEDSLNVMNSEQLQALILLPGFSTKRFVTDVSGRGVGMDVVRTNIERLKGTLAIESTPGHGTRFTMRIPIALATMRVLLVDVGGFPYGLPTESVGISRAIAPAGLFTREGRNVVLYRGSPVPVVRLAELLQLPATPPAPSPESDVAAPCVFLAIGKETFGVFVDALIGEQHLLLKPKGALLDNMPILMGAAILSSGDICTVLDPRGLPVDSKLISRISSRPGPGAS